jgi:succinyl-CoA synthetase beta subunit
MGQFANGFKGGVHILRTEDVEATAEKMIGQNLVTRQSGAEGKPCDKLFIVEKFSLKRELYLSILLDRSRAGPMLIMSPVGGMGIEELAVSHPD